MIEIWQIFWASPIELRIIILTGAVAIPLLSYFGIKGTDEAIDFQNRMGRDEKWRKKNK